MSDREHRTIVQQATFGAGCFWGAEAFFRQLPGGLDSRVGFARPASGEKSISVTWKSTAPAVAPFERRSWLPRCTGAGA